MAKPGPTPGLVDSRARGRMEQRSNTQERTAELTAGKEGLVVEAPVSFLSKSGSSDRGGRHLAGMVSEGTERMQL